MKPIKPLVPLLGDGTDILYVLYIAQRVLCEHGFVKEADKMTSEVLECHDYQQALNIMSRYVEFWEE